MVIHIGPNNCSQLFLSSIFRFAPELRSEINSISDLEKKESDGRDPPQGVAPHAHRGVVGASELCRRLVSVQSRQRHAPSSSEFIALQARPSRRLTSSSQLVDQWITLPSRQTSVWLPCSHHWEEFWFIWLFQSFLRGGQDASAGS